MSCSALRQCCQQIAVRLKTTKMKKISPSTIWVNIRHALLLNAKVGDNTAQGLPCKKLERRSA
jgi:hypothetical protein